MYSRRKLHALFLVSSSEVSEVSTTDGNVDWSNEQHIIVDLHDLERE